MSSPINIQQSVLQAVITERIQQVQQQHPDMQQRYFEHHLSQERLKKMHKVNDFEEVENIRLREKEDPSQRRERHPNKEQEFSDAEGEAAAEQDQAVHINIKV